MNNLSQLPEPIQTQAEIALGVAIHRISIQAARLRQLYTGWLGLTALRDKAATTARDSVCHQASHVGASCEERPAYAQFEIYLHQLGIAELSLIASLNAGVEALELDPKFAEARTLLTPLCDERDRLKHQIEAERIALQVADQAIADAEVAAAAEAAEAARNHPAVIAAREARAKFDAEHAAPAAPFRGPVNLHVKKPKADPLAADFH